MGCNASTQASSSSFIASFSSSTSSVSSASSFSSTPPPSKKQKRKVKRKRKKQEEKILEEVRSLLALITDEDRDISEECEYSDELLHTLDTFYTTFHHGSGKHMPLNEVQKIQSEICELVEVSTLIDICCDIIIQCYQKAHFFNSKSIKVCTRIILNLTDASDVTSEMVTTHPEFLETLKSILEETTDEQQAEMTEDSYTGAMNRYISIIHNLAMRDSSIVARLRHVDFINVLRPYLESSKRNLQLIALSALAGIVNEEESEIINANRTTVEKQLKIFQRCLQENERYKGWSCRELAKVVRMLAWNDANKRLLVELGVLGILIELAKTGDDAEKTESTGAIWMLCFDEENKQLINEDEEIGVIDLLTELSDSENEDIRDNCLGALWTLNEDRNQEGSTGEIEDKEEGHVMISYQWADQETIKNIVETLKSHNYKVWIDIEDMGGSTLEAMAGAVERATVVLICFSEKYKNSPNCRAEAEYAFQQQKTIIPLKLEQGYKPDGWLGMIIGTKLFYEFSPKYDFDEKMEQMLKALSKIYESIENNDE